MKKYKILLIYFFCMFQSSSLPAQTFILYGDRTFGGNSAERGARITYAGDNQFILTGVSSTNLNGDKTDPLCDSTVLPAIGIWILKIDTGFNIVWDNNVGGIHETTCFLLMTGVNKQMIFSSTSYNDSACDKSEHNRSYPNLDTDYWICMIDSNGNKLWDKTFGGTGPDQFDHILRLTSGDYLICGESGSLVSGDKTVANHGGADYWVVKMDSMGNKRWDKVYGGSGTELALQDYSSLLLAEANGGFTIAGTTRSPADGDVSEPSRGVQDIWIIKCDSSGNKIWDRRYGGNGNERCRQIIHTYDGGYIVCAETGSQQGFDVTDTSKGLIDVWILKLDSLGFKQWDKRYGGYKGTIFQGYSTRGASIAQAPGGGYWVSAWTDCDSSLDVSEPSYGDYDYWIFKIDSAGNKLFDKRFGGPGDDQASNFIIMPDSSIYLFGYADSGTSAVKTDAGKGNDDYWLVHFKYVDPVFVGGEELGVGSRELEVIPNPAKDKCTITCPVKNAMLTVYDVTGRAVLQQAFNEKATVNVEQLKAGMYVVEVKDKDGRRVIGKVVRE